MIIAVDFDGTIVKHRYPQIGEPIEGALETLLKLQKECHLLILWTVREGESLQQAVDYCASYGLEFYAVNSDYPNETIDSYYRCPRKINADLFIDDRNLGGLPSWEVIYQMIHFKQSFQEAYNICKKPIRSVKKKSKWRDLFRKYFFYG